MPHHNKPRARLNSRTQFIHSTVIKWLDLAALIADNMVVVVCIIRVCWLIPRVPLCKVDSPGKPLCLKEIDKAISRDKIHRFRVSRRTDSLICRGMQLNHGLWCMGFGQGCN